MAQVEKHEERSRRAARRGGDSDVITQYLTRLVENGGVLSNAHRALAKSIGLNDVVALSDVNSASLAALNIPIPMGKKKSKKPKKNKQKNKQGIALTGGPVQLRTLVYGVVTPSGPALEAAVEGDDFPDALENPDPNNADGKLSVTLLGMPDSDEFGRMLVRFAGKRIQVIGYTLKIENPSCVDFVVHPGGSATLIGTTTWGSVHANGDYQIVHGNRPDHEVHITVGRGFVSNNGPNLQGMKSNAASVQNTPHTGMANGAWQNEFTSHRVHTVRSSTGHEEVGHVRQIRGHTAWNVQKPLIVPGADRIQYQDYSAPFSIVDVPGPPRKFQSVNTLIRHDALFTGMYGSFVPTTDPIFNQRFAPRCAFYPRHDVDFRDYGTRTLFNEDRATLRSLSRATRTALQQTQSYQAIPGDAQARSDRWNEICTGQVRLANRHHNADLALSETAVAWAKPMLNVTWSKIYVRVIT
jgi:hypothetical protein